MLSLNDIILPVLNTIEARCGSVEVCELWGSSKALFLLALQQAARRPIMIVTATDGDAGAIVDDLRFFSSAPFFSSGAGEPPAIFLFPSWGVLPFEPDSPDSTTVGERMRFLYHALHGTNGLFVVPVHGLVQKVPPRDLFSGGTTTVRVTDPVDPDLLIRMLLMAGYESASIVTRFGEFSRRGGIIDFFSPSLSHPVRLELFGDTVESLRLFDPETQRSISKLEQALILPVRELFITEEGLEHLSSRIDDDVLLEQFRSGSLPPGGEFLSPFLHTMESLDRYFPDTTLLALIEPEDILKGAGDAWERVSSGRAEESGEGRILPGTEELYLSEAGIRDSLSRFCTLDIRLLGTAPDRHSMDTRSLSSLNVKLSKASNFDQRPGGTAEGTIPGLCRNLKAWQASFRIVIVCATEDSSRRLLSMLGEYGLSVSSSPGFLSEEELPQPVLIMTGRLTSGFSWPLGKLMVISEEDLFGSKSHRPMPRQAKAAPFLTSFRELRPGDLVIHRDYGVGEYTGLSHISVDGFETDFLALRYEPDAKLYVPLYSLDKVQKFAGVEGGVPRLDRLGGQAWARTKEKIKKDLLEMARTLIALSAARESRERPAFSGPDTMYREFEAAFPYEETPDQQKAIEEVLSDMQRRRPMDRLVCGDVGYGKTEVALRAAFKAVEDGFQVAILVPTTLLAEQHARTFSDRLSPFTIRVEMLSRFRSRTEVRETLRGLKAGTVDIVIGTHRLLQRDVFFRNLGMLIVDEEHRFGVKHKERIKEFRNLVDVLTLSATPIPRTLHMSLSGLRDLSIIQTPPLDRHAIQVVLARFGKRVIREAILQELARGGQVFFIHNRVQGIERMADFIQNLVPESSVGIAHGQMKEDSIEEVMSRFIAGQLKVLVTTTIIESGIDIPNANTIIINRADRFGLADLYQIKGRVGRGRQKAFAYLLTPSEEALPDLARKRLRAIQELSELGAGFRIAAKDLETRGAGNLLGKQQSGHIAAVGIDLYTEMMEEALSELRGEEPAKRPDTQINMRVSAFIPEDYIEDMNLRLSAYKEVSGALNNEEVDRVHEDLLDRYGPLPEPLSNLLEIMRIKIMAQRASVSRIDASASAVNITFAENAPIRHDAIMSLLRSNQGRIKLIPEYTLRIALRDPSFPASSDAVKKCLQELG